MVYIILISSVIFKTFFRVNITFFFGVVFVNYVTVIIFVIAVNTVKKNRTVYSYVLKLHIAVAITRFFDNFTCPVFIVSIEHKCSSEKIAVFQFLRICRYIAEFPYRIS